MFGLILFGTVLCERIKPRTRNEILVFILACVMWPIVSLGVLVLSLLSAIRKAKNKDNK